MVGKQADVRTKTVEKGENKKKRQKTKNVRVVHSRLSCGYRGVVSRSGAIVTVILATNAEEGNRCQNPPSPPCQEPGSPAHAAAHRPAYLQHGLHLSLSLFYSFPFYSSLSLSLPSLLRITGWPCCCCCCGCCCWFPLRTDGHVFTKAARGGGTFFV